MQHPSIFEPLFLCMQSPLMLPTELNYTKPWQAPHEQKLLPSLPLSISASPISCTTIGTRRESRSCLPTMSDHEPSQLSCPSMSVHTHDHDPNSAPKMLAALEHKPPSPNTDFRLGDDDGSVAIALLSSITKSISSPSLQLKSSKEAARETPYQKWLKLKQLKLQHCAEALGMESSDSNSSLLVACEDITNPCSEDDKPDIVTDTFFSSPQPVKAQNQDSSLTSPHPAPKLNVPSKPIRTSQYSKLTRCASFPPPLSHTLPSSPSGDSLSPSLRAYRQDGHFILEEVMVPSKNYFHANRKDGRLTLHIVTRHEIEGEDSSSKFNCDEKSTIKDSALIRAPKDFDALKEDGMAISTQATGENDCSDHGVSSITISQALSEDVLVKASVRSASLAISDCTEMAVNTAAGASKGERPEKLQCIATCRLRKGTIDGVSRVSNLLSIEGTTPHIAMAYGDCIESKPGSRNDKINVKALMLQITANCSEHTPRKVAMFSSHPPPRPPLMPLGSMKQPTFMHLPAGYMGHGLSSSHHDMGTFSQSKENFVWESNLMQPGGASHDAGSGAPLSDMGHSAAIKNLMRLVSELAKAGARFDGRDWSGRELQDRDHVMREAIHYDEATNGGCKVLADSPSACWKSVINVGDGLINVGDGLSAADADEYIGMGIHTQSRGYKHLEEDNSQAKPNSIDLDTTQVSISSSLYPASEFGVPSPTSLNAANFDVSLGDEWLHSLHSCKELSDYRNQCYNMETCRIKPHCIATRS